MLRELHISNLAVIEDARIELSRGLNAFTGQTGAGKSLVLGAFEILLGLKSTKNMVRPDAKEARVSGLFEVKDPQTLESISQLADQPLEPAEPLLITRKFFPSGRSAISINGLPATATMLKQIGHHLVDIHGQHDHQFLLKPANQLIIVDNFADVTTLRKQFTENYNTLRDLLSRKQQLITSQSLRAQQIDLYEFQANEIDDVDPHVGEFPELQAQHKTLKNASKIHADASNINTALYESDSAIISRLEIMTHLLRNLTELDSDLEPLEEQVRTATITLQEASFELSRYISRLDANPEQATDIESRLNQLNRLIHKYAKSADTLTNDPVQAVIDHRNTLGQQLEELYVQDTDLTHIDKQIADLSNQLIAIADQLTAARSEAAQNLKPLIESQLIDLGMSEAILDIQINTAQPNPDNPLDAFNSTGLDSVDFLIKTNPGQPSRPLRKIASGGELSRIMLALKSILASSDRISVLVFDEIDANIGGRLGSVIGQKLHNLAHNMAPTTSKQNRKTKKYSRKKNQKASAKQNEKNCLPSHSNLACATGGGTLAKQGGDVGDMGDQQVLCITHLPQIAAFADRHLRIEKSISGRGKSRKTSTTVTHLDGKPRVEELAEMISGHVLTPTTLKQAKELLETAQA
ncbi:DNA repair protein RecN [Poriferisphaera corsica]|uniref:DNA repair protein RecN n=1 Tax=Poriferisphaera corsica TaxID=2528020 RepID=A0A517YVZ6_9BACT|nr:DNA repair protein RecN [Poriferisphaera corsica]QDU34394.1 DNA repair protein RecN [Poriferisphaera corsica]